MVEITHRCIRSGAPDKTIVRWPPVGFSVDLKSQTSPVRTSLHKCSFCGRFARRKHLFSKKNMKVRPQTRTPVVMFSGQMILKMYHLDTRTEDMPGVIQHPRKMWSREQMRRLVSVNSFYWVSGRNIHGHLLLLAMFHFKLSICTAVPIWLSKEEM